MTDVTFGRLQEASNGAVFCVQTPQLHLLIHLPLLKGALGLHEWLRDFQEQQALSVLAGELGRAELTYGHSQITGGISRSKESVKRRYRREDVSEIRLQSKAHQKRSAWAHGRPDSHVANHGSARRATICGRRFVRWAFRSVSVACPFRFRCLHLLTEMETPNQIRTRLGAKSSTCRIAWMPSNLRERVVNYLRRRCRENGFRD